MILVIVGQLHLSFDRLLMKMDEIAPGLEENVIMQIGVSQYIPKNTEYFNFESEETLDRLYDECSLLVCHSGAGTILNGLSRGKPIVMVPRKNKYKEVTNDHQMDIAKKMVEQQKGIMVEDIDELPSAIEKARQMGPNLIKKDTTLTDYLSSKFEEIAARKKSL